MHKVLEIDYLYVGTGKHPMQQEKFVNSQYSGPNMSNGSYQMSASQLHYNHRRHDIQQPHLQQPTIPQVHYRHHQQSHHLQQSVQPQLYYDHQQNIPLQHSAMHYPPTHIHHTTHTPRNYNPMAAIHKPQPNFGMPQQYVKKQQPPVKNVNALPKSKIPANSPILWELSQDVREWKFLGRNLDLEEEKIDEIDYNTIPNKTREKALKVLTEWVNSSTPTWETLGEALMDAEYILLYEKLLELVEKYARLR